jgi:hypothetical protein
MGTGVGETAESRSETWGKLILLQTPTINSGRKSTIQVHPPRAARDVQLETCSCWCPAGVGCRGKYKAMLFFASFSLLPHKTLFIFSYFHIFN